MIVKLSVIADDLRLRRWSRRYCNFCFMILALIDLGILIYLPLTILLYNNNSNKPPTNSAIIV